jgi:hypothetical protein
MMFKKIPNPNGIAPYNILPNQYNMGDLNQFKRSKERIKEVLAQLVHKNVKDEQTSVFIADLQSSIHKLETKIEEFRRQKAS